MYKNLEYKFFFLVVVFALLGSAWPIFAAHDLVIFHTNDVHGYAFEAIDDKGRLVNIGYDRLKAIVDADDTRHKLLLDGGDVLNGQAFATIRKGEFSALLLSLIGYDAIAAGNHDFDYGYERLLSLVGKYRLNFVASNVKNKEVPILPPYIIRNFDDMKVGIFGLSTPETYTTTDPRNIIDLKFEDPVLSAKEMVKHLRNDEGVDLVIAVMHMGSETYCKPMSQTIAREVGGIDLIVDGHSHSNIGVWVESTEGSKTLLVSSGSYFNNLGRVFVDRKPKGGFELSPSILPASNFEAVVPDIAMSQAMAALKAELDVELNQIVMSVPFDLDGSRLNVRGNSTNLGRLICASLLEATGADAAMLNGGSIRDSIASGEVTKGEILSVLPYGNYVFTVEITGADLKDAINHGLGQVGSGAFPQFFGMEISAIKKEVLGTNGTTGQSYIADSIKIGGKLLKDDLKYTIAINDFMHSGGDGYDMFTKCPYKEFATLEEALKNFLSSHASKYLEDIAETKVFFVK